MKSGEGEGSETRCLDYHTGQFAVFLAGSNYAPVSLGVSKPSSSVSVNLRFDPRLKVINCDSRRNAKWSFAAHTGRVAKGRRRAEESGIRLKQKCAL